MKEFILMNKETGQLAAGIRFSCFDHQDDSEIDGMPGYRVYLKSNKPDAWAIQVEGSAWIMVAADQMKAVEVIGEL